MHSPKKRTSGTLPLSSMKKRVKLVAMVDSLDSLPIENSVLSLKTPQGSMKEDQDQVFFERVVLGNLVPQKFRHSSSLYQHLHSLEMQLQRRRVPNYTEAAQNEASAQRREILLDWLVEVSEEFHLVSDTLYLTVSYVDRFLTSHAVARNKLQLLGVSCMLIASKHEEIRPPHVEDFCYIADNAYTKEEVMDMEKDVLKLLGSEIRVPTIKNFLRILTVVAEEQYKASNLQFEFLCSYLAELTLVHYYFVKFLPSMVAASAIFLSTFTINPDMHPWSLSLQRYSGYRPSDLKHCVVAMHQLQLSGKARSSRAVLDKYMHRKYKSVALLSPPSQIPAYFFEQIGK